MNWIMLLFGAIIIAYAFVKDAKPLLLVPLGFGILVGNIPDGGLGIGVSAPGSILNIVYLGVQSGVLPPILFFGIGAMTDFSPMLANPKALLLGMAAPIGIFVTILLASLFGFSPSEAFAIGIAGGGDPAAAVFLSTRLGGDSAALFAIVCLAAVLITSLTPLLLPPTLRWLTTAKERAVVMDPPRIVGKLERRVFPVVAFLICALIAPGSIALTGMLFFGNLLKESGVAERLAGTARGSLLDIAYIFFGFGVGMAAEGSLILSRNGLLIFAAALIGYPVGAMAGVFMAKCMNKVFKIKINPLIGAAGVAALPEAARAANQVATEENPHNYLLMHAMGPNVAGLIATAITVGILWAVMV